MSNKLLESRSFISAKELNDYVNTNNIAQQDILSINVVQYRTEADIHKQIHTIKYCFYLFYYTNNEETV